MSFTGSRVAIRSALSNNTYVALPVYSTGISSIVVGREKFNGYVDARWPPRWGITRVPAGGQKFDHQYSIVQRSVPITVEGDALLLFFSLDRRPARFAIESTGGNLVRFYDPEVNSVWTLVDNGTDNPGVGTPVKLEDDEGLAGQRWSLEFLD